MAKLIKMPKNKEFIFAPAAKGGFGGETKYPWDTWLNGDLLLLEQSVGTKDDKGTVTTVAAQGKRDYEVDTNAMPAKLKTAARKRYKVVQVSRVDADGKRLKDSLAIRARDMTAEERAAEDIEREAERAAAYLKRQEKRAAAAAPSTNGTAVAHAPTEEAEQVA